MPRVGVKIRKARLIDQDNTDDLVKTSPADRIAMVWPLTLNAWSFKEGRLAEPRLQRHIIRVYRRER
jgi:hypothetical protein